MAERWTKLPPGTKGQCRWCQQPVKPPRQTWCSQACVDDYLLRKSGATVRRRVFERDRGMCALCGLDTERARRLYLAERRRVYNYLWRIGRRLLPLSRVQGTASLNHGLFDWPQQVGGVLIDGRRHYVREPTLTWWQADHIVPVAEGGGACGLDNYRTLCRWCHPRETGKLRRRLNVAKRNSPHDEKDLHSISRNAHNLSVRIHTV